MNNDIDEVLSEAKTKTIDSGDGFEGEIWFSTDGKNTVRCKSDTPEGRKNALIWGKKVFDYMMQEYGTKQAQAKKEYSSEPDLGKCNNCGAPNKKSLKTGKLYCSALCWKNV